MKGKILLFTILSLFAVTFFTVVGESQQKPQVQKQDEQQTNRTQTKESQMNMTPQTALEILKKGNERFVNNVSFNRDLQKQVRETADAQYPFATILSCQDSRTSNEQIFDLNKGDAFSIRIAGNIVNDDILGGMEFGSKLAGAKLIVVLGHTKCGAVKGACDNAKLGNLTGLLDKIQPAVKSVPMSIQPRNSKNEKFVDLVAEANVREAMKQVREKSPILKEMIDKGEVGLVGGIYSVSTGKVEFLDK